jgi:hypothetical protein
MQVSQINELKLITEKNLIIIFIFYREESVRDPEDVEQVSHQLLLYIKIFTMYLTFGEFVSNAS